MLGQWPTVHTLGVTNQNVPIQGVSTAMVNDDDFTGFVKGIGPANVNRTMLRSLALNFSDNNITDIGFQAMAGVVGSNLLQVNELTTNFDRQVSARARHLSVLRQRHCWCFFLLLSFGGSIYIVFVLFFLAICFVRALFSMPMHQYGVLYCSVQTAAIQTTTPITHS